MPLDLQNDPKMSSTNEATGAAMPDAPPIITPDVLHGRGLVAAGFSLRHGGVSSGPYRSLNVGLSTGDADANVIENRRRLFRSIGLDPERLAIAGQVHGDRILEVDAPGLYPGFDGLVTSNPGIPLCITAADCAVVLLADSEADVVGACHSGWRGTAANIAQSTIDTMQRLGASPERILAYVSPCISAAHFEVGPEVAEQFDDRYVILAPQNPANEGTRGAPSATSAQIPPTNPVAASSVEPSSKSSNKPFNKPHVDLKAVIRDQLLEAGVPPDHLEISPRCTYAETGDFFSYRAEHTTGRMMGFICLTHE